MRVPGQHLGARDVRRDVLDGVPFDLDDHDDGTVFGVAASGFGGSSIGSISTFTMCVSSASRTMNLRLSTVRIAPSAGTLPARCTSKPPSDSKSPGRDVLA